VPAYKQRAKATTRAEKSPAASRVQTAENKAAEKPRAPTTISPDVSGLPLFLSGGVPAAVNAVLQSGGQPLDDSTRAAMQSRLGHDFSRVHVHTDTLAAQSAESIAADAYTVGTHVVFGPGKFEPGTTSGRRLLTHELTHVTQQHRPHAATTLHRQPKTKEKAAPKKFYQYVIDSLAAHEADLARQRKEKKYEFEVHVPMTYRPLKALLPLAEAVDQEKTADIPKLVDDFIKAEHGPPFRALSRDLLIELSVRLVMLGLDAESTKLRENFSKGEQQWDWAKRDVGLEGRNLAILTGILERTEATADYSTNEATKATMARYLKVLVPLRDDMLDMSEFDRQHIYGKPRYAALLELLRRVVGAMSKALQALTDRAVSELGSGNATQGKASLLLIRELIEGDILPILDKTVHKRTIAFEKIVLVPTEVKEGKGVIRDAFDEKRNVKVETYSPKQKTARDLEGTIHDVFTRRVEQVALMARIYGQTDVLRADRPGEKEQIEDAKRNAAVLKSIVDAGGTMRLESDDDWRDFVLKKYQQMTTGTGAVDRATALSSVMKLLYKYLEAFTIHARFTNIYDKGDFKEAYFNKPFPRTLSGQLVHDCGVYALRVAYILSLVRDELSLSFRYIRLPAHVGLVITGKDLPLYIAHNNHYTEVSIKELEDLRAGWKAKAGTFGPEHKGTTIDEDQLIGEIASAEFISGSLAMPFRFSEVPGSAKTAIGTQKALWKDYQEKTGKDVLGPGTAPKKDADPFHTRYLAITQRYLESHNYYSVPFWNEQAPKAWTELETALKTGSPTELTGKTLKPLVEAYLDQLTKGEDSVNASRQRIKDEEASIGKELRADEKLRAKDTRLTRENAITMTPVWQITLRDYRKVVEALLADAKARPDGKFDVAATLTKLAPPFIPVKEKGLRLMDLLV
jgi:hypothetical protein